MLPPNPHSPVSSREHRALWRLRVVENNCTRVADSARKSGLFEKGAEGQVTEMGHKPWGRSDPVYNKMIEALVSEHSFDCLNQHRYCGSPLFCSSLLLRIRGRDA